MGHLTRRKDGEGISMLTQRARDGLLIPGNKIAAPVELWVLPDLDWAGAWCAWCAWRCNYHVWSK